MKALRLLGFALGALCIGGTSAQTQPAPPQKVLKLAYRTAETGFDPAKVYDVYSLAVTGHIFDALYGYDHLARPAKIKPRLAAGMPEVSADFKTWTVKLRPGIYFADDQIGRAHV